MSSTASGTLAGSVRWAVVPSTPASSFRLHAGRDNEPITVPDADVLIEAARRGGDAELSHIVPGKVRPMLVLTDPPTAHHQEVTALRLLRLEKLSGEERERVQGQAEELRYSSSR